MRVFVACVVGYALSPIDLIPDPSPVLGYLDDLVLIPLGIALAVRMIPSNVLAKYREKARAIIAGGQAGKSDRGRDRGRCVGLVVRAGGSPVGDGAVGRFACARVR